VKFEQIIGHQLLKKQLTTMNHHERLPHSIMLVGPSGCGGVSLARAFASYLLCEHKSENDSCGKCDNCQKNEKLIHADVHFSYPVVTKKSGDKPISTDYILDWRAFVHHFPYATQNDWMNQIAAENKQGNITAQECLEITKKLSLKAFEGGKKILILWLPEFLAKEGNRLLKLIEEPPDNTIFIFVAEDTEQILPTILSRCQLLHFHSFSDQEVEQGLELYTNLSSTEAQQIAQIANGNLGAALDIANHSLQNNSEIFIDWLRKCYVGNGIEMIPVAEKIAAIGKEQLKNMLTYGLHIFRELMMYHATGNAKLRLNENDKITILKLSKIVHLHQIDLAIKLINQIIYHIERNANTKILFVDASLQLNNIFKFKK